MELDIAADIAKTMAMIDSDDSDDDELVDDLLFAAIEAGRLTYTLTQEVGPEYLSMERLRRECGEYGTNGDGMSWELQNKPAGV